MTLPFKYNYHKAELQKLESVVATIRNYKYIYNYEAPKYLQFMRVFLELGYVVKLYKGGKKGISKYVFVKKQNQILKIRFSDHLPVQEYENAGDCDFYVGISHNQTSTTEEVIQKIKNLTK